MLPRYSNCFSCPSFSCPFFSCLSFVLTHAYVNQLLSFFHSSFTSKSALKSVVLVCYFSFSISLSLFIHFILNPLISIYTQARIQTQESQIIECEAALKTRNEELKILRSDNTELTEKCETLDLSLLASIENAETLQGQLSLSEVF